MKDYTTLKLLLEKQETFPVQFTYKFIGRNSAEFATSVEKLLKTFPKLQHEMTRKSGSDQHLAMTYLYEAPSAGSIIEVFQAIEKIDDLLIIL